MTLLTPLSTIAHRLPRRKSLPSQRVQSELLVQDPVCGRVHFLNPTAAIIWDACDGQVTTGECDARLREAFEIPPTADLAADILETVGDFRRRGMLE